jgi:choline-glycine betaine transporter
MFSVVGLLLALMCYRENLPLTMKSCLYPLIGDCIFGWIGDVVDVVSIMGTLFGVCTSLGIASRQVNLGLSILNPSIEPSNVTIQVYIVIHCWIITIFSNISYWIYEEELCN